MLLRLLIGLLLVNLWRKEGQIWRCFGPCVWGGGDWLGGGRGGVRKREGGCFVCWGR